MYWIIGLFDEKTEQIIKNIWKKLSEESISFYEEEIKEGRPHITFGSYYDLNKTEYIRLLDKFYEDKNGIDITFNTIGSFLNYGTLFLSPTVTKELIDFHSGHHEYFKEFNENANSLYLPGKWIPHCTLANRLPPEKLSEAFNYCLKGNDIIYGNIKEIALIELVSEDSECVEAPIIYSKPLKI
jgi:hypothetical protein